MTALLAATAISGPDALPVLEIAMVRLTDNFLGVVVIFAIPLLCRLPIMGAEALAQVAAERKAFRAIQLGCLGQLSRDFSDDFR